MEAALGIVLGKLVQQIQNETALVRNFKQDFQWLNMRLIMLTATLQSADENMQFADGKGVYYEAVQQWTKDVRDILWDVEDLLDEYSLHKNISDVGHPRRIIFRYTMGRKIRKIKYRMKSIIKTANELMLIRNMVCSETRPSASTIQPGGKWKKSSMMEYGSVPVAVDIKVQEIKERLEDPEVQVLAVVGMGGIGKTFLLQHVYNEVKHMFEDSVWLSVSQTFSLKQLQRDLAVTLDLKDLSGASCTIGAEIIHDSLKEKKCLIVLDDVWRATEEDDLLKGLGIPIEVNNRCKVIVTSRNKEVFSHLHPFIYEMALLSAEDSWKLFCAHAFSYSHKNSQQIEVEKFAREMEKECGRLPLAIKTVASSLAKATTCREWELKLHQLKEVRKVDSLDSIMQILKLSYYWLPPNLKPCFGFLSFFPEDKDIDCEYLVNLWIAEGFIPQTEDQVAMAWDYLRQLANLCLVDVWEPLTSYFSEPLHKYCRVHDLVLELAVQISKENKSACSAGEVSVNDRKSRCRHILFAKKGIEDKTLVMTNFCCPQVARTLSLSQNLVMRSIPPDMLSNARVLRVLDLSHTGISTLPESVGALKLLRILNLSHTQLTQVPQCVRKLKNLRFLDVSGCKDLFCLPLWIGELVALEHLGLFSVPFEIISRIPKGISKLVSLSTLRSSDSLRLSVEDDEYLRLEDIGNMTCLQELRIKLLNEVEIRRLAQGILGHLVKMRMLELVCRIERFGPIPLLETIRAMEDLQTLKLYGNFSVPGWTGCFKNLRVLELRFGWDYSELYPTLETMGNLTLLRLANDKNCKKFPKAFGKCGGFPKLRAFYICDFEVLEELPEMEDGAMASLQTLDVRDCQRVTNIPQGFQGLKRLREFSFVRSGTDEYRSRLKEEWSTFHANNQHVGVEIRGGAIASTYARKHLQAYTEFSTLF